MIIDLLKEMSQINWGIGLSAADLPSLFTLCKTFDRIDIASAGYCCAGRHGYTTSRSTLPSTLHSTNVQQRAAITASESATAFRSRKSRNSSILTPKRSSTYIARQPGKEATQTSPSGSPAGTRAICGFSPPIRVMISRHSTKHCVNSALDHSPSLVFSHHIITHIAPEPTNNATISVL